MNRNILTLVFLGAGLLAGRAFAVLPPDAAFRAPQIRAEYMRSARAYEERQQQRQREAIEQYRKTEADIFTPPWKRTGVQVDLLSGVDSSAVAATGKTQKRNHRLLTSIVLLILISAAGAWARHATREVDEL